MPDGALAAPPLPDEARFGDEPANLAGWIARRRLRDVAPFVPRDLREQAAGDRRARLRRRDVVGRRRGVAVLDQEPAGAPAAGCRPRADEYPGAAQLAAAERELQLALLQ